MADIRYEITFWSNWHCGSGLAAGADIDSLVVRDRHNLPFVPGKTMKGLVREAMENLNELRGRDNKALVAEAFGHFVDSDNAGKGCMFFTNAELAASERKAIVGSRLQSYLYMPVSQTAIDKDGIAKDHSLRRIETVVPCVLEGMITTVPDALVPDVLDALRFIKRLGSHRNRGLGRCSIAGKEVAR